MKEENCATSREPKRCLYCNEIITNDRDKIKKFCSRECYYASKASREIRKCLFCGNDFIFQCAPSKIAEGKGKYCSRECADNDKIGKISCNNTQVELKCPVCNKDFKRKKSHTDRNEINFCSRECKGIYQKQFGISSGENNYFYGKRGELSPNWKGGILVSAYDTYYERLLPVEEVRRSPDDEMILECRCTYCNSWMKPTRSQVENRIQSLEGRVTSENRFYCNDKNCRDECSIFNRHKYPKGYKEATSREVQPELRKMCFERDDWTCQRCGAKENLHCHHMEGIRYNPLESADLDLVITVCKSCHKWIHSQDGCTPYDLRCS